MCGIGALMLGDTEARNAAEDLHEACYTLQHRGQDAAGIAVCQGGRVYQCKGLGMASKVFDDGRKVPEDKMPGFMGVAHLRYPTAGTPSPSEAQPLYVNSPFGVSMAVNGNLVNAPTLKKHIDLNLRRHVNTDSDSELLLNIFAWALGKLDKPRANVEDVFTSVEEVYKQCHGAYAVVGMIAGFGILGFRDANGIRPLCLGSRPSATDPEQKDYMLASESIALKQLGFTNITDILPGQAVFLAKGCAPEFKQIVEQASYTPDLFEWLYFARPDTKMDAISVHRSRQKMGEKLAVRMKDVLGQEGLDEIDVVIPIPETSNTAAASLAQSLSKTLSHGFVKSRYVFRTFILPGQKLRQKSVRRKLSTIESEFKDKVVCLVDDSIVRGTTSREIVQMVRECQAKKIILVSCSPEITHQHVHGIDLADPQQLLAHNRTLAEMTATIGCDTLIFQTLDDLIDACLEAGDPGHKVEGFETGVFCGKYTTEVPPDYLEGWNTAHAGDAKTGEKRKNGEVHENGRTSPVPATASSGVVNGPIPTRTEAAQAQSMEHHEDISLHNNFASES